MTPIFKRCIVRWASVDQTKMKRGKERGSTGSGQTLKLYGDAH
tara:strand:+ start:818 stop:946 length:129 start_codon:yes stop_codon:yes gene_type:complete